MSDKRTTNYGRNDGPKTRMIAEGNNGNPPPKTVLAKPRVSPPPPPIKK